MSKHLSKEELQTDPLIENYNKAANFFNENRTTILAILISVIVVVGALVGYNFYAANQEQEAQQLLAIAEGYYTEGDYDKAINGDSFELTYGFLAIANDYSGTEAGNLAIYYAAVSSFKLGNIEDAIEYFSRYDAPEGILGVGAISFNAKLFLANGSTEKAADTFVKAANWDINDTTTPYNLYQAAEAYFEAGNFEKARQLSDQIIEEYPTSSELANAQKLQGKITVAS
ncbi:MAG: tetratricopeptide repeat protein [Balneola sp.]